MTNLEKLREIDSDGMAYFMEKLLDDYLEMDKNCNRLEGCKGCLNRSECIDNWLWKEADPYDFD